MLTKYTVVGLHIDDIDVPGLDASYVEWVNALNPDEAADVAKAMYEDRVSSVIIAVFEGHIIDVLNDKGLASG